MTSTKQWKSPLNTSFPSQGGGGAAQQQKAQEQRAAQMEDMKNSILSQALTQEARARRKCKIIFIT